MESWKISECNASRPRDTKGRETKEQKKNRQFSDKGKKIDVIEMLQRWRWMELNILEEVMDNNFQSDETH